MSHSTGKVDVPKIYYITQGDLKLMPILHQPSKC